MEDGAGSSLREGLKWRYSNARGQLKARPGSRKAAAPVLSTTRALHLRCLAKVMPVSKGVGPSRSPSPTVSPHVARPGVPSAAPRGWSSTSCCSAP